ncbi:hypothetical protein [Erythrobacter sp. JK5]|uniref:DMP19 family protein n=1 Tax=Erythrobacter sp. JK5 TaxID=2829500 RepID=UPI001BAAFA18|nr:hypothetical protein [Erythrobacter sp. JK5]QUL39103.1 hypothetical protein KDC96_07170 [Erythrobacter sp. JK5]
MTETRPVMTDARFEEAASFAHDGWWLTGEDSFLYVPEVMGVEGWNFYGSPGNLSLTDAQRTLMLWSDIVGQVSNGGFTQLIDNYPNEHQMMADVVEQFHWDELDKYFVAAMLEQAESVSDPSRSEPVPLSQDPEKWAASRERLIEHLVRSRDPATKDTEPKTTASNEHTLRYVERQMRQADEIKQSGFLGLFKMKPLQLSLREWVHELHDEDDLQRMYVNSVAIDGFESGGERYFDFEGPETAAAEAFEEWFYTDECKQQSKVHVHEFIVRNRDELCRPA